MNGSYKLVKDAIEGKKTSRTPIYDLLVNDSIIEHFAGAPLDGTNDIEIMYRAAQAAVDSTRSIFPPNKKNLVWTDGVGNIRETDRWTQWIRKHAFNSPEEWVPWIENYIENSEYKITDEIINNNLMTQKQMNSKLGETVYIHCTPSTAINNILFGFACGLDNFSYLLADYPELISRWMRAVEKDTDFHIDTYGFSETSPLAIIYSDVAYHQKLMFSKNTFNQIGFFEDVERICQKCHKKGLTVIFHSDGYIMDIMDELIAAGIDGLNPIEKAAGMDIYEIRRKYPDLILAGGLDVTHLLPFGTPEEVKKETRKIISETGSDGRLLIGSSTEMSDNVPLDNFLAFWDEVMK